MRSSLLVMVVVVAATAACETPDPAIEILPPTTKAVEIDVEVAGAGCTFMYVNGATATDLHVPIATPTRLVLSSRDGDRDVVLGARGMRLHATRRSTSTTFAVREPTAIALECPAGVATAVTAVPRAAFEDYVGNLRRAPTTPR